MSNSGENFLLPDTPPSTPGSAMAVASGSPKTGAVSNNRAQQDSVYDSDIDLAVHDLHIDSSYLHPGYKPNHTDARPSLQAPTASREKRKEERRRQRNTAHEYQEKAKKMSSTPTPSPSRPPPPPPPPSSNSSDSSTSEQVPRKLFRSYPSLRQKVREGSTVDEGDIRRFRKEGMEMIGREVEGVGASFASSGAGPGAGRTRYGGAGGEDAHAQLERGYDGDVEMEDAPSDGESNAEYAEVERGYDGDIEMGDVPPHEAKGASSGSNGFGRSDLPVKQTEGENNKSKKRARFSDQADEEEEKVEHERGHKRRRSGEGSCDSCQ